MRRSGSNVGKYRQLWGTLTTGLAVLALAVGFSGVSGQERGRWVGDVVVEDYSRGDWPAMVARQVDAWDAILPISLVYVRKAPRDCGDIPAIAGITVCSGPKKARLWGITRWGGAQGVISSAQIRLFGHGKGHKKDRLRTVCHEFAHALLGIGHDVGKDSCVRGNGPRFPGSWDREKASELYSWPSVRSISS